MPGRRVAGPTIAAAAAAGGAALLVLVLSPVPTVRGFGLLLVAGIAIAFLCALTVGSAALALQARRGRRAQWTARCRAPAARRAAPWPVGPRVTYGGWRRPCVLLARRARAAAATTP